MSGFSMSGLGSGINWDNYIDSVINAEQESIQKTLGRRQAVVSAEKEIFSHVEGLLKSFDSVVDQLGDTSSFVQKTASSSDAETLTVNASDDATVQSFNVTVEEMATQESWIASFSDVDDVVTESSTTFRITVRGVDHTMEVEGGTTLSEFAEQLNDEDIGVSANVYDSGDGSAEPARLTITDAELGVHEDGSNNLDFALTDLDQFGSTPADPNVDAKDSKIILNGDTSNPIFRSAHVVDDVIPGVTMDLLKASNDPVTVTVQDDHSVAEEKIGEFVEAFNEAVKILNQATDYERDSSGKVVEDQQNPTAGNSTLRNIHSRLTGALTRSVNSLPDDHPIQSLSDLGISVVHNTEDSMENGTLELDTEQLNEALEENPEAVVGFFQGVTKGGEKFDGFQNQAEEVMKSITDPFNGMLPTSLNRMDRQLGDIQDELDRRFDALQRKEERLTQRFARLESQLSSLNSQQSQLESALNSIANTNQAIANKR